MAARRARSSRSTARTAALGATLATTLALAAPTALAARWFFEAGVVGQVTATDNSGFENRLTRDDDLIVAVTPTFALRAEGARLRLGGQVALSTVTYVERTLADRFDPQGSLNANLEAIERWLFIDASVRATRSLADPLGPRIDDPSGLNRRTELTARLSPYIDRTLPNGVRVLIRSDNAWTDLRGGEQPTRTTYAARHLLQFSREPRPLGWALEAERRRDDRVEQALAERDWYEIARLRIRYAFGGQFIVGARAGVERSVLFLDDDSVSFAGVEFQWRPSERTRLEGFWEDRAFGDASELAFEHRSPFVAWNLRTARDLTTFDDAALVLPATGDLAALLDAALRTRIVDPVDRARAVEEFITRRGLPRSLPGPINVFAERPLLRTTHTGTVTFIGLRSTIALSGFYQLDQTPAGDLFGLTTGQRTDLTQQGATVAYSRRLTAVSSALASVSWIRARDTLGAAATASATAAESRQQTLRVQFDRQLAPRTTGFVGARYQTFESETAVDARETAVFAGLGHRF